MSPQPALLCTPRLADKDWAAVSTFHTNMMPSYRVGRIASMHSRIRGTADEYKTSSVQLCIQQLYILKIRTTHPQNPAHFDSRLSQMKRWHVCLLGLGTFVMNAWKMGKVFKPFLTAGLGSSKAGPFHWSGDQSPHGWHMEERTW